MNTTHTLRRYTNLASLISILKNKELTLLPPSKWEDKNDTFTLKQYAEHNELESIYALCFTTTSETAHHWKVFSQGSDGVCISIKAEPFINSLADITGLIHGHVTYKLIDKIETETLSINDLPFLKRYAFRDEEEYRVIFRERTTPPKKTVHTIPFDISHIQKITLSNSLPDSLKKPIVELLKSIEDCNGLKIYKSTLNENQRWIAACKRAR